MLYANTYYDLLLGRCNCK